MHADCEAGDRDVRGQGRAWPAERCLLRPRADHIHRLPHALGPGARRRSPRHLLASDCGLLATRVLLVVKLRLFWRLVGDGALGWCVGAQLYRFFLRKGMPSGYFFVPALFMYRPALPLCLLPPSARAKRLLAEHMNWTRLLQVGVVGYLEGCGPEDAFHRRRGGHNTQA